MKAGDIQACVCCSRGVCHAGIVFYTLEVRQWGIDPRGVQQIHGLEQMMGGGAAGAFIARTMGPDPDIAMPLSDPSRVWVCAECAMKPQHLLLVWETGSVRKDAVAEASHG